MHLVVRQASPKDFDVASTFCIGSESRKSAFRHQWDLLWDRHAFGVVVTDLAQRPYPKDLSILVCNYLADGAMDELRQRRSKSALEVLTRLDQESRSAFLDPQQVAAKNAGDGLDLFVAAYGWHGVADDDPAPSLRALTCNAVLERHGGNRHRNLLVEASNPTKRAIFEKIGLRPMDGDSKGSTLMVIGREEALASGNLWLARLFTYFPPRFHFTDHQRQILLLAREGYTDNEIARMVGAKPDAIKKRWAGIYERVHETFPTLLPPNRSTGRGQEKRRALLTHLRDRPEELRPFSRRGGYSNGR